MTGVFVTNVERDGENRPFNAHGHATIGSAGGLTVMKGVYEPGWRWSKDIAPIAGTVSCQTHHLGYVVSGHIHGKLDDGTEWDIKAGDLFDLPAGHDAWVVGDEPCEMLDYSSEVAGYALGRAAGVADPRDEAMRLVKKGYDAFNARDMDMLASIMSREVVQHVPGNGPLAGDYKGIESVLGYYGKLGELTDGTFRVDLIELHGDHHFHVAAVHQSTATRNGVTRVSRHTLVFSFLGDKITDVLELHADLPGDDAFLTS